jgi:RsiW-degrading membrane proteinase PrsW (M82 family)
MQFLTILVLGFTPGLFWLWLIYSRDKYRPEPRRLVIRTFLLGIAVAVPVAIAEVFVGRPVIPATMNIQNATLTTGQALYLAFVVAGLIEELAKFIIVRFTVYHSPYFDEPIDGIIYASAVALGFASIENVGYMLSAGWQVILVRGWFTALGHVIFTPFWGYALGRRALAQGRGSSLVVAGLLGAIGLHGTFDYFLFADQQQYTYLLFVVGLFAFVYMIRLGNRQSPYRNNSALPLLNCAKCGEDNHYDAAFCQKCGSQFTRGMVNEAVLCSNCHSGLEKDAQFCSTCGSRINKKKL